MVRFKQREHALAVDPNMAKRLVPVMWSKAQTAGQLVEHIRAYPRQDTNSHEAELHSIEFQEDGTGPCGTLAEIKAAKPHIDRYFIYPRSGNGLVEVNHTEGEFVIGDAFGEGIE